MSFLIIFSYLIYIIIKYGIPKSISQTYYLIQHKWVFSIILILSTILTLPSIMELNHQYLAFITICGVLFVAFAPNFMDDELVDSVHTYAAIIAFIASQLLVLLNNPIVLCCWIPYLIYITFTRQNFKFWAEIIMLITICLI